VETELSLGDGEKFVGTQEALAAHLGVDRKSIARWQKKNDCPGRSKEGYDVGAWRAFVEKNNLGRKPVKGKAELENEKIALGNERARLINEKLRGEVMHQDEVVKVICEVFAALVLQLGQSKNTIAEECAGIDRGESVKRVDRRHKEVLENLALGSWAQKKTFWSKVYAAFYDLHRTHGLGRGARIT
jgi:hypothetical protein